MNEGLENDEEKFSMDDPFVPRAENRLEKYNSARAIFYPSFFSSTLPIVNSWLGTFFFKKNFHCISHFHKFLSTFLVGLT